MRQPKEKIMTLGRFRNLVKKFPDEFLIVLAKDAEGNEFSPCDVVGENRYEAENDWAGDLVDGTENCVVLWPAN